MKLLMCLADDSIRQGVKSQEVFAMVDVSSVAQLLYINEEFIGDSDK